MEHSDEKNYSCARNQRDHLPHPHHFADLHYENERRTFVVVIITLITMIAEITAGYFSGSMALLSDGWHMGTHAAALGIAWFAYRYSRKNADLPKYTFGTGKIGSLAAYSSAILLGITGLLIIQESVERLIHPVPIHFDTAILVAVIGLAVNAVCAGILAGKHPHLHSHHHSHCDHDHDHSEESHGTDHNFQAAFIHVLADALTSVIAIAVLLAGRYYGLIRLDPIAGFLGAIMILIWAFGLIRQTGRILLDCDVDPEILSKIRTIFESEKGTACLDLHVWKVSESKLAVIVSLLAEDPQSPEYYRELLDPIPDLVHVSIEVHRKSL
ncbi:MAG: CDF family Co(II)/Ni(II) efflux transporter DmeF [Planctomycetia bacterium]|nr:CDF family Co(II)/Ni(II) efflux transporter DmeF [Planctomycetia bacterium]